MMVTNTLWTFHLSDCFIKQIANFVILASHLNVLQGGLNISYSLELEFTLFGVDRRFAILPEEEERKRKTNN